MIVLDQKDILKLIPHAFPFVMLDRVLELEPGRRGIGVKTITVNDCLLDRGAAVPYFSPTFVIEACGHLTAVVCAYGVERTSAKLNYLAAIPRFRFHPPLEVGQCLRLESVIVKKVRQLLQADVHARVGGRLVAEGSMIVTAN